MSETTSKLLIVRTGGAPPEPVDVSLVDLREAIVNDPEVIVGALRDLLSGTATTLARPAIGGDLPVDVTLPKMVNRTAAAELTSAARKLTKADLLALGGFVQPAKTPADLNLTFDDIRSISRAFQASLQEEVAGLEAGLEEEMLGSDITISRCSCCPCCSCCAASEGDYPQLSRVP